MANPADAVEHWPIERLTPHPRNARTHPESQVASLAASMKEWGWTRPVLVDEAGVLLAGHGTVLAGKRAGFSTAPVVVARGWSDEKKRAYLLADNRLAQDAAWDVGLLDVELAELASVDFNLPQLAGFDAAEIARALNGDRDADPEDVPPLPIAPISRPGDIWKLGEHRVICGDATSESDVSSLLGDARPHLMVTDPPYGVDYDPDWRNRADRANGKPYGARAIGQVLNDDRADWREAWALFPGQVAYCWHAGRHASGVQASLEAADFEIRCQIVWAKPRFVISRGNYHWQHEPCWYAVRKGGKAHWSGDRSQTTLWAIEHVKSETGHGTQKPVECMRRPIENNSRPGQSVYDPFLGSGTTVIAAALTGRKCYGLEIDPGYTDVIVRRWQQFTSAKAVREADGKPFDEVASGKAQ